MRPASQLVSFLLVAAALAGCGQPQMSDADRDRLVQEKREEIELIKKNSTMSPQQKRDLIERTQLQLDELSGASADTE